MHKLTNEISCSIVVAASAWWGCRIKKTKLETILYLHTNKNIRYSDALIRSWEIERKSTVRIYLNFLTRGKINKKLYIYPIFISWHHHINISYMVSVTNTIPWARILYNGVIANYETRSNKSSAYVSLFSFL